MILACSQSSDTMVYVRGGSFQMGDTFNEGEAAEQPVHEVRLSSFLIAPYEVTVGEFREFITATGYRTSAEVQQGAYVFDGSTMTLDEGASWRNPGFDQTDRHPVVCVSWYDAIEYCNWRSRQEGREPCFHGNNGKIYCNFGADGYRLPTEAEYEYAARCRGRLVRYTWGSGEPILGDNPAANILDESAGPVFGGDQRWIGYDDSCVYTAPVGSYASNDLGIYDMSGNVYEWCWDWRVTDYYDSSPSDDPVGPDSGSVRACRDIGFRCPVHKVRVANRGFAPPGMAYAHVGLRLVRTAP